MVVSSVQLQRLRGLLTSTGQEKKLFPFKGDRFSEGRQRILACNFACHYCCVCAAYRPVHPVHTFNSFGAKFQMEFVICFAFLTNYQLEKSILYM